MSYLRVAVVGDAGVDVRRFGHSSRTSPEDANCKVVNEIGTKVELGMAGNVAAWLAVRPELQVSLFCHYAGDTTGIQLRDLCIDQKIRLDTAFYRAIGCHTTRKERICVQNEEGTKIQQLVRCDVDTDCAITNEELCAFWPYHANHFDLVVVADYDKSMFKGENGDLFRKWLSDSDRTELVVVNSKRPDLWADYSIDALICNHQEALKNGLFDSDNALCEQVQAQYLAVTLGRGGVECFWNYGRRKLWSGSHVIGEVCDVTGAGDAFTAGFAFQYLLNLKHGMPKGLDHIGTIAMMDRGQRWAAHCCAQIGCGTPIGIEEEEDTNAVVDGERVGTT